MVAWQVFYLWTPCRARRRSLAWPDHVRVVSFGRRKNPFLRNRSTTVATKKAQTKKRESAYPRPGTRAPAFTAPASDGRTVKLSDFKGRIVVLYFYPKDNTSGCTKEACGFRDAHTALTRAGIIVLGVSPDSVASHEKFIARHDLPFLLLADEDKRICEKYGVWQEKSMYGRKYMGVARTTFVIDQQGKIAHVFEKVKPAGHDQEVLAWVKEHLK